jgi:hypothetical protein
MNVLNDVTAVPFLEFFTAGSIEKNTVNSVAVTLIRTFVRSNDFKVNFSIDFTKTQKLPYKHFTFFFSFYVFRQA